LASIDGFQEHNMLIKNANVITWGQPNSILLDQGIYIKEGVITEIGSSPKLVEKYGAEEQVDANGQYVMPGSICAHTHFYSAFSRGLAIPGPAAKDFSEILEKLWWKLDKALSLEDSRYSASVSLIDAIRHGTTTLIDHHAAQHAIAGSLDEIAEAVTQSGVRAALCYEVTDRDGKENALAGIKENARFIERTKKDNSDHKLGALFGLHASLTLSDDTLNHCREAAPQDTGFHIHVAEGVVDEFDSLQKYGTRIVDRLQKHQILGPHTIVAHGVHVDARETELLSETQTWVSHQPRSNMNNAVGMAEIESMARAGVKVCLGNDGFSNSMWEEWKATYFAHKLWHRDPRRVQADLISQIAIYNNAALASSIFGTQLGVLAPGAQADLMFVDYHPFTELSAGNLPWHIVFGFQEDMVTATMVAGKFLMLNRELLTLDEDKITHEASKLSQETWKRFAAQF
jgi:putative selenium metabolism protein SsnA